MPRLLPPRRVSLAEYWRRKINAAPTESARLGEACDYLRAMAKRYPEQMVAQAELTEAADELIKKAKQLGRGIR